MSESRSQRSRPGAGSTATRKAEAAALATELLAAVAALPRRTTPALRGLRRSFSKRIMSWRPAEVLAAAGALLRRGGAVPRFVAYELIAAHQPTRESLDARAVERLGRGISSWGEVDCFACYVAGPAWRNRQISDSTIHRWAQSRDLWWRRAALVATVPLNARSRGGSGDARRTLAVCARLAEDREDLVVKALSWALRELGKRDPAAVAAFLRQAGDRLAPRVRREVTTKLETGRKYPPAATTARRGVRMGGDITSRRPP